MVTQVDSIGRDRTSYNLARQRIKAGEGFVYLAEFDASDIVKIGFSLNPARRVRTMNFLGWKAKLIAAVPGGMRVEKAVHRALLRGEHSTRYGECYRRSALNHPAVQAVFGPAA